jgi:tRNA pseudouridine13 synthase
MRKRSRSQSGNRDEADTPAEQPQFRYEASADESLINVSCSLVHLLWEQGQGQPLDEGHRKGEPTRLCGEIKTLYTDFTVRELDPTTGLPCRLTSIDPLPEDVPQSSESSEANSGAPLEEEAVRTAFRSFVSSESEVEALVKFALAPTRKQPFEGTVPIVEKEARTLFHQTVRKVLGSKFDSSTTDDQRMKVMYVGLKGAKPRGGAWGSGGRNATEWPAGRPEHLHFTVYKENIDSTSMLRQVATKIGLPQKAIMFAGTKDKRGVTLQRCSVHKVSSFKVAEGVNRGRGGFGPNCKVKVGNFSYSSNPVKLGAVTGNRFEVLIRHLALPPNKGVVAEGSSISGTPEESKRALIRETVAMVLRTVKEFGFINYFGPQRFGTTSIPTSEVGCRLLAGKYKDVVRMVLQSKAEFVPQIRAVLAAVDQGNYAEALELTPHFCFTERDMLRSLSDSKGSFEAAVTALPRPLTMLYCHAVQSLVWNEFVGRRLRLSATSVLLGDLVRCGTTSVPMDAGLDVEAADADLMDRVDPNEEKSATAAKVKVVTEEDLAANLYSIADVVLPVVGPDEALLFPQLEAVGRQAMASYLASIGATPLLDASAHLTKKFHFHGTYRTVIEQPKDLEFSFLEYETENQQLVETDWMKLNHEQLGTGAVGAKGLPSQVVPAESSDKAIHPPERLLAAKVEFSLGPGSYATSLLRELLLPRTRTHS